MGLPKAIRCCGLLVMGTIGAVMLVVGIQEFTIINDILGYETDLTTDLDNPKTDEFQQWADPHSKGIIKYTQLMVWNLTNPEDFLNGIRANFSSVGPITYVKESSKHSFQFSDGNAQVWYKETDIYRFVNRTCRNGTKPNDFRLKCSSYGENKTVTTVNVPLVTILEFVAALEGPMIVYKEAIAQVIENTLKNTTINPHNETLVVNRKISQVVFGYRDPVINAIVLGINKLNIPAGLKMETPGYAMLHNYTSTDVAPNTSYNKSKRSAIHTRASHNQFGKYLAWQGNNASLNFWTGCDERRSDTGRFYNYLANLINGTSGEIFQPGITKETTLSFFYDKIYRSALLAYNDSRFFRDLQIMRFTISKTFLRNVTHQRENCAFGNNGFNGIHNMSAAVGCPIFASDPYFLGGDKALYHNLSDYRPSRLDRSQLDSWYDIEPVTATVVRKQTVLQASVLVRPISLGPNTTEIMESVLQAYFPILFVSDNFVLGDNYTQSIGDSIDTIIEVGDVMNYLGPVVGVILVLVSFFMLIRLRKLEFNDDEERRLLLEENTDSKSVSSADTTQRIVGYSVTALEPNDRDNTTPIVQHPDNAPSVLATAVEELIHNNPFSADHFVTRKNLDPTSVQPDTSDSISVKSMKL